MKYQELIKILKKADCVIIRHGAEHDMWKSPKTGNCFPVARHKKEIPSGTLNRILKDAGLK